MNYRGYNGYRETLGKYLGEAISTMGHVEERVGPAELSEEDAKKVEKILEMMKELKTKLNE